MRLKGRAGTSVMGLLCLAAGLVSPPPLSCRVTVPAAVGWGNDFADGADPHETFAAPESAHQAPQVEFN